MNITRRVSKRNGFETAEKNGMGANCIPQHELCLEQHRRRHAVDLVALVAARARTLAAKHKDGVHGRVRVGHVRRRVPGARAARGLHAHQRLGPQTSGQIEHVHVVPRRVVVGAAKDDDLVLNARRRVAPTRRRRLRGRRRSWGRGRGR